MTDPLTIAADLERARTRCEDARVVAAGLQEKMLDADADDLSRDLWRTKWRRQLETVQAESAEHARLVAALVEMAEGNGE